jgi:hypothetical protein
MRRHRRKLKKLRLRNRGSKLRKLRRRIKLKKRSKLRIRNNLKIRNNLMTRNNLTSKIPQLLL